MKSDFAKLISIKDKVALILFEKAHMAYEIEKAWDVKYIMKFTFQDCLESISHSLAYQQGDMHEELGRTWERFQEKLPELYVKTAPLVERMQKLLAAG